MCGRVEAGMSACTHLVRDSGRKCRGWLSLEGPIQRLELLQAGINDGINLIINFFLRIPATQEGGVRMEDESG